VSDEETNNCETVDLFEDKFGKEHMHFSPNEMEELKVKESALMERNASNYYRCKIKHAKLYADITAVYMLFIIKQMLVMLHHTGDTQKNEAMNASVAAYAPKGKTYSQTSSLTTRVAIATGVANVGKYNFWTHAFSEFNITMDDHLADVLKSDEKRATKKRGVQESKEGKVTRSQLKYKRFKVAKNKYLGQQANVMEYRSGIAVAAAKKTVRTDPLSKDRNTGLEKEQWR
jgi:hypothetical protein